MAQAKDGDGVSAPSLNIPPSSSTCELWAINTTTDIVCPSTSLLEPEIRGHENLNLPTYAFLIHNKAQDKRILFDNGARRDWWNAPPSMVNSIFRTAGVRVKHDVADVLVAGGVDVESISAVVWSHWHWDHVGNIQRFPKSTDLVVGPGFRDDFLPGYPTRPDGFFHEADFDGRRVHEVSFSGSRGSGSGLRVGRFQAHDFFGDGSFYILFTPGHTPGHLCGLVRTTPTTFAFLGGDIAHFPGMYRPTRYVPMPETLPSETPLDAHRATHPCPCAVFTACHPDDAAARSSTYYRVSRAKGSWFEDPDVAQASVDALQEFDASDDVFVAVAHDPALKEVVGQFPASSMTEWKAKGWGRSSHWHFVNELPVDGKPGRPLLVDGIYKEGKLVTRP